MQGTAGLAYRRLVSEQVSGVGLIIALYDALAADLLRAAEAERRNALEERGRHLKHGFNILTQLEVMLSSHEETPAEKNLRRFYRVIRDGMHRALFARSSEMFEKNAGLVLEVRGAWQELELRNATATPESFGAAQAPEISQPLDCSA